MSMLPDTGKPDSLTRRIERALGYSRVVRSVLLDCVVPHLSPLRRGAAEHIVRQIDRGRALDERMLHDLDALIAVLEREAERGTHHGWEADEHHVRGGWPTVHRDARATALVAGASELRGFHAAVAAALDAVEAERLALRLLADD